MPRDNVEMTLVLQVSMKSGLVIRATAIEVVPETETEAAHLQVDGATVPFAEITGISWARVATIIERQRLMPDATPSGP